MYKIRRVFVALASNKLNNYVFSSWSVICLGIFIFTATIYPSISFSLGSNPGPAQVLKKNSKTFDQKNGFTALAVWRLHIEDKTGEFVRASPKFTVGPVGAANNLCKKLVTKQTVEMSPMEYLSSYSTVNPAEGAWSEKDGNAFYRGSFVIELRPGEREFFHLRLESVNSREERWISIPLDAACNVEAENIYDLDLLELVITDRIVESKRKTSFRYFVSNPPARESNTKNLEELYPDLDLSVKSITNECALRILSCDEQ